MRATFALLIAILLAAVPARAQNANIIECGSFDTTVNGTTAFAALGVCNFTTGPAGTVLVLVNAEATCGAAGITVQLFVAPGTSSVAGSNVIGHVSGGVLTVESVIPGLGTAPFLVQAGQFLTGGTGVYFTPTLVTGQLTGTPGGVGTYSIADGGLSQPVGTNLYTLNPLPGGMTAVTRAVSQNACSAGFIISAPVGSFVGTPATQYWIGLALASRANGQSATWNNSSWQVVVY